MNTAELEKLLREALAGGEEKNTTAAGESLRLDEPRRAALLEKLRAGDKAAGKNIISWKTFLRKNLGAIAACAAFAVAGVWGFIAGVNQETNHTVAEISVPETQGRSADYGREIAFEDRSAAIPAPQPSHLFTPNRPSSDEDETLAEDSPVQENEKRDELPADMPAGGFGGFGVGGSFPKQTHKPAVKGGKPSVQLPDMPAPVATSPAAGGTIIAGEVVSPPGINNYSDSIGTAGGDGLRSSKDADHARPFAYIAGDALSETLSQVNGSYVYDAGNSRSVIQSGMSQGQGGGSGGGEIAAVAPAPAIKPQNAARKTLDMLVEKGLITEAEASQAETQSNTKNWQGASGQRLNMEVAGNSLGADGYIRSGYDYKASGNLRTGISDKKIASGAASSENRKIVALPLDISGKFSTDYESESLVRNKMHADSEKPAAPSADPRPEVQAAENPFSTFSLNVSDASFRLAAEALRQGRWPERDSLRTEEFINALRYNDPPPAAGEAVAITQEQARDPFAHNRNLLRISVQTASAGRDARTPLNITVLLDTSGSMERADRQETLKVALDALAGELGENDTVGVIGFARMPRVLMNPTAGKEGAAQLQQIAGNVPPEGGTNLETALTAAYAQNRSGARPGSQNVVLLLTDGAANLGDAKPENLARIIEQNKKAGIGLNCYGVGFDNYNDTMLEALSRAGNGRYAYLNNADEAREDCAKKLAGALQVAAQNVKVQVEFNPARVGAYRLFGYEKHRLKKEDFRNNAVKAAEIGAAESGTAIYAAETKPDGTGDIGVVRVRWQNPKTGEYVESERIIPYNPATPAFSDAPAGVRLAGAAALLAEHLQGAEGSEAVALPELLKDIAGANRELGNFPENRKLQQMTGDAARLEK